MNFAGDAAREVREQIKCGTADVFYGDGPAKGRVLLLPESIARASEMPAPASVRIGPAEIALTRMPRDP